MDATENLRRGLVADINRQVAAEASEESERIRLEQKFGQVWNIKELSMDFEVLGFMAPFISVVRKSDGKRGMMMFQHMPRFYFSFL